MDVTKRSKLKEDIHELIFEADTPLGKAFDIILIIFILGSVAAVMLESVDKINAKYHNILYILEWIFTIFFTVEYILRLYSVYRPWKYATSFFGIVDLLATLPTYLGLFFYDIHYLMVIRALRLLRIFRIFKMGQFLNEWSIISESLKASRRKIAVFLYFILLMVIIFGSVMYLIEGDANPKFDSIPRSIYWAIVTLTTVGYGDISPTTGIGQLISAIVMIMGYAVIAVPTGIVSAEFVNNKPKESYTSQACRYCGQEGHDNDAEYCKYCGEQLNEEFKESED